LKARFFRKQEFITKMGNLKNTKKKRTYHPLPFDASTLLSIDPEASRRVDTNLGSLEAQRTVLDRIDRIFLNLDRWIA
jgi:hypothetical protein